MTEEMIKNHLEYHFEANPKHPYAQLRHIQPLSDKISGRNKQLIEEQRQHGLQRINLRIQNIETTLNVRRQLIWWTNTFSCTSHRACHHWTLSHLNCRRVKLWPCQRFNRIDRNQRSGRTIPQ